VTKANTPLRSLEEGRWFKLICGASFHHLPAIRSSVLAYALAGADCVDVAADPAIVTVAKEALQAAQRWSSTARKRGFTPGGMPWLMVSLNDGEDPHFRKATFDPQYCPSDCSRPCERVCPTQAIVFDRSSDGFSGILDRRCYGCGRCLSVCPIDNIDARSYVSEPEVAVASVVPLGADAIEIHTQVGRLVDFQRLWNAIAPWLDRLNAIAISCPDGEGFTDYLWAIYRLISPLPCPLIWQTDGRPMSGDIGGGTTHATLKLAQKVLTSGPPGYVQLAGGTNDRTVPLLNASDISQPTTNQSGAPSFQTPCRVSTLNQSQRKVAGVAYGSYARVRLSSILNQLENIESENAQIAVASTQSYQLPVLETHPHLLWEAANLARELIAPLKETTVTNHSVLSQ